MRFSQEKQVLFAWWGPRSQLATREISGLAMLFGWIKYMEGVI